MKIKRNCCEIMDKYLSLDKGERVPLSVTLHLLICRECRKQIHLLKTAEKLAKVPLEIPVAIDDFSIESVMAKIDPEYISAKNPISIAKWVFGGIAMILFMLVFGLSNYSVANKTVFISFYILFAICITVYCAMFVGTNIDFFVKKIETTKKNIQKTLKSI